MKTRLVDSEGMTLVELLVAMFVMAVGITAIVSAFTSGLLTIQRGAKTSTAGVLADKQMEAFRRLSFGDISTASTASPTDPAFSTDPANSYNATYRITAACPSGQTYCIPSRQVSASGGSYWVDTWVVWACPLADQGSDWTGASTPAAPACSQGSGGTLPLSRPLKLVTVVVRDASNTSRVLIRSSATFDQSTG